mgnify:FL=1
MWGIGCIFISCVLFIHLGLGEAIERTLQVRFVLLRYVKCPTFWSILAYSLVHSLPVEVALCAAFVSAYAALWMDIPLAKLATLYENLYKDMDAEEPPRPSATAGSKETEGSERQESPLPEL